LALLLTGLAVVSTAVIRRRRRMRPKVGRHIAAGAESTPDLMKVSS
jgi:hypothetical protein